MVRRQIAILVALLSILFSTSCSKDEGEIEDSSILPALSGTQLRIASYNLMFEKTTPADTAKRWSRRLPNINKILDGYNVDIVGSQEACTWQVNQLVRQGKYSRLGVDLSGGLDNPKYENEALFYLTSRFKVIKNGQFWYSTWPGTAGSYSWDATYARACTWGKFMEIESGVVFYVFNSHFHNEFPVAKLEEAKLLIQKAKDINTDGLPMFFTGDFNGSPGEDAIQYIKNSGLVSDTHDTATIKSGGEYTYHGFNTDPSYGWRLDYVFVNNRVQADAYRVIDDERTTQKWSSDHFPVIVDATLN